jgi:hypothetical protein
MKVLFDRIVLLICGVALALDGLALVDFLLHPLAQDHSFHSTLYRAVVILVLTPLTLLVGFLIIRRVPGNIVGPLLIVWSGTVAYGSIREEIGPYWFALFYYYDMVFGWLGFFLMLLHFPDGKIYPPGAAPWIYRQLGINVFLTSLLFMSTAYFQIPSEMANPFYVPGLQRYAGLILGLGILFFIPILGLVLISPVLRYRKGSALERNQLKWLALFAGFSVLYVFLGLILYPLLTGGEMMSPGDHIIAMVFFLSAGLFPPLAIGVAVLRHRLWDIDLIIRRTLVYSILTMILTLVYFGSVVLLQALFQLIIGQNQPPIATVLSTLTIIALFTPFRRRVQTFIDRRFYRQKYDAERILEAFSKTLRQEVDLDHLTNSILGVVEDAMKPTHVSLRLREGDPRPGERKIEGNPSQK